MVSALNKQSEPDAKIALFRSLFRGRYDVYPRRFENGYFVLRFLAEDVGKRLDEVLDSILRAMAHRTRERSPTRVECSDGRWQPLPVNAETQHWLDTALACDYVEQGKHAELLALSEEVGKLIGSMIQDAHRWCASVRS